jgi:hypothetical protein
METTVLEGQSLLDIALQELGSLEGAYNLAVLNGLSLTDSLTAGMTLQLPDVVDRRIKTYYSERNIRPATMFDPIMKQRIFDFTFDFTFE